MESPTGIFRFFWDDANPDGTVGVQFVLKNDNTNPDPSLFTFEFTFFDPDTSNRVNLEFLSGHTVSILRTHARVLWHALSFDQVWEIVP
jgi:hypothetical protein